MKDLLPSLLPIAILLLVRLWNSGAVQATIGRYTPRLPKWLQWLPPMALSVGATVAVWLVQGVSDATLTDTLTQGGTSGLVTIGLWHVAKRVIPVVAVDQVRNAAARSGLTILLVLVLLGGGQACSGSNHVPQVCPIPTELLSRLPPPAAVASAVQAAQGVVEQAKDVAQDPRGSAAVLVASRALDALVAICPTLGEAVSADCAAKLTEARAVLARSDATREQVCGAVALAVAVAPELAEQAKALAEVCR